MCIKTMGLEQRSKMVEHMPPLTIPSAETPILTTIYTQKKNLYKNPKSGDPSVSIFNFIYLKGGTAKVGRQS